MGRLLSYAIVSGIVMLAMYLVYKLSVARDKQHGFNRGVLLSIYLVSLSAWPVYSFIDTLSHVSAQVNIPLPVMPLYVIETENVTEVPKPVWGTILIWIYLAGAAVVSFRTIITWIRIVRLIHSGRKIQEEGYTLVVTDRGDVAPFSWIRYVVVSRQDFDNGNPAITAHELKHLRSLHWIDLLVAQMVCIVGWFNPAVWLMRDELMLVHEYQADMAVIDSGCDIQEYQMLLVKKAVGSRFPSLANSMNHSKLKKRITMMYRSKSSAPDKMKAFALVPIAALAISVASIPAVKAAMATISSSGISLGKDSEKLSEPGQLMVSLPEMQAGSSVVACVAGEATQNQDSDEPVETTQEAETEPAENAETINGSGLSSIDKAGENSTEQSSAETIRILGTGIKSKAKDAYLKDKFMVTYRCDDGKETTLRVEGGALGDNMTVSGGILTNKGEAYHAKSLSCTMYDGIASITSVFPAAGDFENASLVLTINGEDVKLPLRDYHKGITLKPAGSDKYSTIPSEVEIYLDGKKITDEELKTLDPSNIASIDVNRESNRISITSK